MSQLFAQRRQALIITKVGVPPAQFRYGSTVVCVAFVLEDSRVDVIDRGSQPGVELDGRRFGGASGDPGPVFLDDGRGELVLGNQHSEFRFNVALAVG